MRKSIKHVVASALTVLVAASALSIGSAQASQKKGVTFPLEKPVKFTLAASRVDAQPVVQEVNIVKELLEKANVDIKWIDWPASAIAEKKSLAFNSGDYPDAIMGGWVTSTNEVVDYAHQGMFVALEEYFVPEVMPNFTAILEERPSWIDDLTIPDGHIYALPSLAELTLRPINDSMIINTEWLEAVDMDMPETTDDLLDVLRAFKEAGDLNGNGRNDEIPMSLMWGNHMYGYYSIMGFWGLAASQTGLSMDGDTVIFNSVQPEFKEMIKYFSQLYKEGLLDPEIFTLNTSAYLAKTETLTDDMVGVFMSYSLGNAVAGVGRDDVVALVPPLKGSPDVEPMWQARVTPLVSNLTFAMTDKASKEVREVIMAFIDLFYDETISIRNFYGEIDKNVKHVEGIYYDYVNEKAQTFEERYPDVLTNRGMWVVLEENFQFKTKSKSDILEAETRGMYVPYVNPNPHVSPWLLGDEVEELSLYTKDITDFVKTSAAAWISTGDVEKEWDAYIAKLNSYGLEKYVQIYQDAYDRSK